MSGFVLPAESHVSVLVGVVVLYVLMNDLAHVVGALPSPGGDALERLVDHAHNRLASDSDTDHGGDILEQILGVLLGGIQGIDPDVELANREPHVLVDNGVHFRVYKSYKKCRYENSVIYKKRKVRFLP